MAEWATPDKQKGKGVEPMPIVAPIIMPIVAPTPIEIEVEVEPELVPVRAK